MSEQNLILVHEVTYAGTNGYYKTIRVENKAEAEILVHALRGRCAAYTTHYRQRPIDRQALSDTRLEIVRASATLEYATYNRDDRDTLNSLVDEARAHVDRAYNRIDDIVR